MASKSNSAATSMQPTRVSARRQRKIIVKNSPINDPNFPHAPVQPLYNFNFPEQTFVEGSRTRIRGCNSSILKSFPWSHYDVEKDRVFCFTCITTIKKGWMKKEEDVFIIDGFNVWLDLSKALRKHQSSETHTNADWILKKRNFAIPRPIFPSIESVVSKVEPEDPEAAQPESTQSLKTRVPKVRRLKDAPFRSYWNEKALAESAIDYNFLNAVQWSEPSVLYLISLVKDKPLLYDPSHEYYASAVNHRSQNMFECWVEISDDMAEAGYEKFSNWRACQILFGRINSSFYQARYRYIQNLMNSPRPGFISAPVIPIYRKMLWKVPYITWKKLLDIQAKFDMTKWDEQQIEDPALSTHIDCSVLHEADEADNGPKSKKTKKEIRKMDCAAQTSGLDPDPIVEIVRLQLNLLTDSQKDEYLLRIQKLYAQILCDKTMTA